MEAHLREARLQSVIPKLDDWGVEEMEEFRRLAAFDCEPTDCVVNVRRLFEIRPSLRQDLLILEDEDVDAAEKLNLVEKRKLKNLLKTLRGGSAHESIE